MAASPAVADAASTPWVAPSCTLPEASPLMAPPDSVAWPLPTPSSRWNIGTQSSLALVASSSARVASSCRISEPRFGVVSSAAMAPAAAPMSRPRKNADQWRSSRCFNPSRTAAVSTSSRPAGTAAPAAPIATVRRFHRSRTSGRRGLGHLGPALLHGLGDHAGQLLAALRHLVGELRVDHAVDQLLDAIGKIVGRLRRRSRHGYLL